MECWHHVQGPLGRFVVQHFVRVRRDKCRAITTASQNEGKDQIEWDTEWTKFKKQANFSNMEDLVERPEPPRVSTRTLLSQQERQIREQESRLVNVWTQQAFFLAGGCAILVLLIVIVVGAGPPPSDPRCTLPWC
jgi:hypothetical protein